MNRAIVIHEFVHGAIAIDHDRRMRKWEKELEDADQEDTWDA
jgi:hypothetical protein